MQNGISRAKLLESTSKYTRPLNALNLQMYQTPKYIIVIVSIIKKAEKLFDF